MRGRERFSTYFPQRVSGKAPGEHHQECQVAKNCSRQKKMRIWGADANKTPIHHLSDQLPTGLPVKDFSGHNPDWHRPFTDPCVMPKKKRRVSRARQRRQRAPNKPGRARTRTSLLRAQRYDDDVPASMRLQAIRERRVSQPRVRVCRVSIFRRGNERNKMNRQEARGNPGPTPLTLRHLPERAGLPV